MFLNNKYTRWYFNIIRSARLECRTKRGSVYFENHHILPKCLFGNNDKSNMVLLTAKEHFICHKLLCKMVYIKNDIRLMNAAMSYFTNNINRKLPSKYIINAREYIGSHNIGQPPWNLGIPHSEETKIKIGRKNSRCTLTEEGRLKKSEYMKKNNPMKNQSSIDKIVNKNIKTYKIIDPTGNEYIISNLKEFCKENNLHNGNMCSVSKGRLKHSGGWKCLEINNKEKGEKNGF